MFERFLRTAFESGGDVLVQLQSERYQGRILEIGDGHFTLFHSGVGGGVLWMFRLADVAYCGLAVERPSDVARLSRVSCHGEPPDDDDTRMMN